VSPGPEPLAKVNRRSSAALRLALLSKSGSAFQSGISHLPSGEYGLRLTFLSWDESSAGVAGNLGRKMRRNDQLPHVSGYP
jgi:hypothetical protein